MPFTLSVVCRSDCARALCFSIQDTSVHHTHMFHTCVFECLSIALVLLAISFAGNTDDLDAAVGL